MILSPETIQRLLHSARLEFFREAGLFYLVFLTGHVLLYYKLEFVFNFCFTFFEVLNEFFFWYFTVLPAYPGIRTGERAGTTQPVRGGGGARQAGRGGGVPGACRRAGAARALHRAPPRRGASAPPRRPRRPPRPPRPPRPRRLAPHAPRALAARRGARAVELHPAAAPRPARNRRRPVARSLGPFTDVNNVLA